MTYKNLIRQIENYLRQDGRDVRYIIKNFINESVIEFARLYDWERLKTFDTLTLDGSLSYTLDSTNLSNNFVRELKLVTPYSSTASTAITEYTKYNYDTYMRLPDSSYSWAVFGNTLYVPGTSGSLQFFYITSGDFNNYPLTDDSDEVPATQYYDDVIQKMVVTKYLDFIGDTEMLLKEEQNLARKLQGLRSAENRARHSGKHAHFRRGGLG